jgi:hypothetical protein
MILSRLRTKHFTERREMCLKAFTFKHSKERREITAITRETRKRLDKGPSACACAWGSI